MFDDLWLVPRGKKKLVLPYEDRADAVPIRAAQAFTVSLGLRVVDGVRRRGATLGVCGGLRELPPGWLEGEFDAAGGAGTGSGAADLSRRS